MVKSLLTSRISPWFGIVSIEGLPTYAQALVAHAQPQETEAEMQKLVTRNEQERLY